MHIPLFIRDPAKCRNLRNYHLFVAENCSVNLSRPLDALLSDIQNSFIDTMSNRFATQ